MTYAEKIYAMTGTQLIEEAEKLGVKLNKKGNALKESKVKAADKIIAAYEATAEKENQESGEVVHIEVTDLSAVVDCTAEPKELEEERELESASTEKKESKKKERKHTKKTFEELVALIPIRSNMNIIRNRKGEAVVKVGTKQIFRYTGPRLVVIRQELLNGLEYTTKTYGHVLKPTADNMRAIINNVM